MYELLQNVDSIFGTSEPDERKSKYYDFQIIRSLYLGFDSTNSHNNLSPWKNRILYFLRVVIMMW